MTWDVKITGKAAKQLRELPANVQRAVRTLLLEITAQGPIRSNWHNYGKLKGKTDCHHCHLQKGNPTYVAVWQVTDREGKKVEVRYVGTHEKADYRRLC